MQEATTIVTSSVSQGSVMDATAVASIGALVAVLTQIVKRSVPGNLDCYGPLVAAVLAAGGVALWVYSAPTFPPERTDAWAIGAGWVSVFATAVGVYESVKMATATAPLRVRRSSSTPPAPVAPGSVPVPHAPAHAAPVVHTSVPRRRAGQMPEVTG